MRTREMLEAQGYVDRVIIADNKSAPFQAIIKPDENTTGPFVAWIVDRRVFEILDGRYMQVDPIH